MILIVLDCIKFKLFVMLLLPYEILLQHAFLLYHAYVYLEFLILACTIYILAPFYIKRDEKELKLSIIKKYILKNDYIAY